jgi:LytS/YehU family sensor histidine kinase
MPFVENSFKHLSHFSNGKKNVVNITADKANGEFSFSVVNTIEYKSSKDPVGGIGLKNVKRRLELLYNGRHELQVQENVDSFKVDLKIKI